MLSSRRLNTFLFAGFFITCGLTILAYWNGLSGPFFLDDLQSIEPAKMENFSFKSLMAISLQNDTGPIGRPISVASFALNSYFFGDEPFSFKVVNLALHLFIAISIGFFVSLIVKTIPTKKRIALPVALLCATLWLIHPLQVSTVLYPVQRMTQLCHLFILLGLNSYLIGRIQLLTKKKRALSWMLLGFLVFFPLSVLSKETGILFIWYAFCVEYFILKFKTRNNFSKTLRRIHYTLSLGLVFASLIYYWLNISKYLTMFAEKNISLFDRLITQTKVIVFYAKLILVPQINDLGLYHDDFPLSTSLDIDVIACSSVIFLAIVMIFYFKKRAPILSFGLAWFLVSQAIESTLLPLELVFEHRNYLASVGLLLIISYYLVSYLAQTRRRAQIAGSVVIVALCSMLLTVTFLRSDSWSNPARFLVNELRHHPKSARVHIEVANWFLTKKAYDYALKELDFAQSLEPYNAGIALHKLLIFCHSSEIPTQLYEEALTKVRQGAITPYVIVVLDQMVQNMFASHCNAMDKQQVQNLLRQALENPFLWYKPMYKAVLYHLDGGVTLLMQNRDHSKYLLYKSFETYPKRVDPLIQKAYLELEEGNLAAAQNTINLLKKKTNKLCSYSDRVDKLVKTLDDIKASGGKSK